MISSKMRHLTSLRAIIFAFIVFSFVMLPIRNGYILRWYDEMSLFMTGGPFLHHLLHYPGGMLQYAGSWLTQFMYYPWLGSAILISLWVIAGLLGDRIWRLPEGMRGLSMLPSLFLLVSVLVLDEAWVSINYPGYLFAPTLGIISSLLIAGAARIISGVLWRGIFLTACTLLFMPLGFYAILGIILGIIGLMPQFKRNKLSASTIILVTIVAIIIVPQLYYYLYDGFAGDSRLLYLEGLPDFLMKKHDIYLWLPFAGIILSTLIQPAAAMTAKPLRAGRIMTCCVILASGCYGAVAGQKSEQFRATVLMMQHIDTMRWDKIAYIMNHIKEPPTFTMKIIGNLARIKLGGGNEKVSHNPADRNGSPRHKEEFLMSAFVNVPVYYHLGNTHGSYRWAMEHTVKYGTRAFYLKYMVRNSIMHGEYELASRYNRLLLNTIFHRDWAIHFQRYIDNPELIKESREFNSIPRNPAETLFV